MVKNLRAAIALCEKEDDHVSRELLEKMLDDTAEDHAHWLEQRLGLIKLGGLQNYLQSQMAGSPGGSRRRQVDGAPDLGQKRRSNQSPSIAFS